MKKASIRAAIVAIDGCYSSSLAGFADVLQVANSHLRRYEGTSGSDISRTFEWEFVSLVSQRVTACNGLPITPVRSPATKPYDLVFIPGIYYDGREAFSQLLKDAAPLCSWLEEQWEAGSMLAANCTGTFILAETGLLSDRDATTTWWLEKLFRTRYPKVKLKLKSMVTECERLSCAGASASHLLQAVYMVEYFCGSSVASLTAKTMLIDTSQTIQLPFLSLQTEEEHGDAIVAKAQLWLQKHFSEPVRLPELANMLSVSERTLIRRFNTALGTTPGAYLQTLRLDLARRLLENGNLGVDETAHQVGYQNGSSFTRLFRKQVGMTPVTYRNRFARTNTTVVSDQAGCQ